MKRLLSNEVGCDLPSPEPQTEISFGKWIQGCKEPLKPLSQVHEWWCVTVPCWRAPNGVRYMADLFGGSFSIWLELVVQPADTQFRLIMVCL